MSKNSNLDNLISAEEFSKQSGVSESTIITRIGKGIYSGKQIEQKWYIYSDPAFDPSFLEDSQFTESPTNKNNFNSKNIEDRGIKVTKSQLIIYERSYSLNHIISYRFLDKHPSKAPKILSGIGFFLGIMGFLGNKEGTILVGAILAISAILWQITQKSTYHIIIDTSGREMTVLTTQDKAFRDSVLAEINIAMSKLVENKSV